MTKTLRTKTKSQNSKVRNLARSVHLLAAPLRESHRRKQMELSREEAAEYVDTQITPTLTKALAALCRERPADPVTFLATKLLELKPSKAQPSLDAVLYDDVVLADRHKLPMRAIEKAYARLDAFAVGWKLRKYIKVKGQCGGSGQPGLEGLKMAITGGLSRLSSAVGDALSDPSTENNKEVMSSFIEYQQKLAELESLGTSIELDLLLGDSLRNCLADDFALYVHVPDVVVPTWQLRDVVHSVMPEYDDKKITYKDVRRRVESLLGRPEDSLKRRRVDISTFIDDWFGSSDEDEGEEEPTLLFDDEPPLVGLTKEQASTYPNPAHVQARIRSINGEKLLSALKLGLSANVLAKLDDVKTSTPNLSAVKSSLRVCNETNRTIVTSRFINPVQQHAAGSEVRPTGSF